MTGESDQNFQRALAALRAGNLDGAEHLFKTVLDVRPGHLPALNLLAVVLMQRGKFAAAEPYLNRALSEGGQNDSTLYNYGLVLKALNRPGEALQRLTQALALNPAVPDTWNNRGTVLSDLKRYAEAIEDFDKAIELNPRSAGTFCNKGKSLVALGRFQEALSIFDAALTIEPALADAWLGRGNALYRVGRYSDAVGAYDKALAFRANFAEAWLARGNAYFHLAQYDAALADFDRGLRLKPDVNYAAGIRLLAKLAIADWTNVSTDIDDLAKTTNQGILCNPMVLCVSSTSAADQLRCAKCFAADRPALEPLWRGEVYRHDRIRVAYLSADFNLSATALLAAGLFERHDRARFELTAISFGPDDASPMRRRLEDAFEHFIDVRDTSDEQIARLIRDHEIDIAVDLEGYTEGNRVDVLARRAAPIQANYLGYPGTMGGSFIDYILADSTVIPLDQCPYYAEQVVWLPNSYQINDDRRLAAERTPSRGECGLPESAFVFCCFNSNYKILPEMFDVWMRLLHETDDSVLWLFATNPIAAANLRREATGRGVAPERLIFAALTNHKDHLARYRLADLFLDTLPCNAHTTASDALWAGLPLLTCLGTTFAGRVAASLLKAVDLDRLITHSLDGYAALALELARNPAMLASIKHQLAMNRDGAALFDTSRATRAIEAAYTMMWERHQRHETPPVRPVQPIMITEHVR